MTKNREYYVSEPEGNVEASVIWLHGLGADGRDFIGIIDDLNLPVNHGVRFIFPSAPFMNVTVNYGMQMRAWYDIYDLNMLDKEDVAGMQRSQASIEEFIQDEIAKGIPSNKIFLAGFSQGGAMALFTGLRFKQPLAGIISLSAYLPVRTQFVAQDYVANQKTPIFIAHGLFDPVVPYSLGQASYDQLLADKYNVEWNSYPMPHTVCVEEIAAISAFMRRCLDYA
jgi:phospholipase/carboxylesterase